MANKLRLRLGSLAGIDLIASTAVSSTSEKGKETDLKVVCVGGVEGRDPHAPVRIKQWNRCPSCEFEASGYTKFPRGRDNGDGTFTVLTAEQLEASKLSNVDKAVTISLDLTAHPTKQVSDSTVPAGMFYYLAPTETSAADYPMFVELIRSRPELTFCTIYAVRTSPSMWRLGVYEDVLTLQELAWPAEVKERPKVQVFDRERLGDELEMANLLTKKITADFDPTRYVDTRQLVLAQFLADAEAVASGATPDSAPTFSGKSSLLAALKASVEAAASGGPVLVKTGTRKAKKATPDLSDQQGMVTATGVAVAAPKRTRAKKSA